MGIMRQETRKCHNSIITLCIHFKFSAHNAHILLYMIIIIIKIFQPIHQSYKKITIYYTSMASTNYGTGVPFKGHIILFTQITKESAWDVSLAFQLSTFEIIPLRALVTAYPEVSLIDGVS